MKPRPVIFLIIAALLASCSTPPLWGAYSTPTPDAPAPLATPTQPPPPTPTTVRIQPSPATAAAVTPRKPTPTAAASAPISGTPKPPRLYYSQSGDTLPVVAAHFGVDVSEINAAVTLPESGLLNPGTLLVIPDRLSETTPGEQILPDSELVFSATAIDFDTQAYIREAGGYLSTYREYLGSTGWTTGAQGIDRLALENSINPRLLIALIEHESGWVAGQPANLSQTDFPLGYTNPRNHGLFRQMMLAVQDISVGYYGWRDGTLTELTFPDGTTKRIAPDLNAGSVAIQYFFSLRLDPERWAQTIDPRAGFPALYLEMFGDPWARAQTVEPLFPLGLKQPPLVLPFEPGREWSFTGGPHSAWEHEGALAALDFAPATDSSGCVATKKWLVAAAPGLVVRSGNGVVVLDLDGDGYEQTGWSLLYLHVATDGRAPLGAWVETDDRIGQPSCEGGISTGTHLHFARKYNGEWLLADGAIPFNLDGWIAHAGEKPYEGTLTRGDETITANPVGSAESVIFRDSGEEGE